MGLFDDYFDPSQFQDSGGLLGRLLSLRPDLDVSQPGVGSNPQESLGGSATSLQQNALQPMNALAWPGIVPAKPAAPTSTPGITQRAVASGNSPEPSPAVSISPQPPPSYDLGANLNTGFQKWAQTPVGNPFAALANGIIGFNAAQPGDAAFIGPPVPPPAQTPDVSDRLGASFQSWAHTPVGNPFAVLANGITGFNTGQTSVTPGPSPARTDPAQAQKFNNVPNAAFENLRAEQNVPIAQNMTGNPQSSRVQVGHFETPANPNAAFGELLGIQASRKEDTASGEDYASGVRDGNIKRNENDSLDVTNGTVVTYSFKNDSARIITVTGSDIAHISKTGEVVIQKAL